MTDDRAVQNPAHGDRMGANDNAGQTPIPSEAIVPDGDVAMGFTLRTSSLIVAAAGIVMAIVHSGLLMYLASWWFLFLGLLAFCYSRKIPGLHGMSVIVTRIYWILCAITTAGFLLTAATVPLSPEESVASPEKVDSLHPSRSEIRALVGILSFFVTLAGYYFAKVIK